MKKLFLSLVLLISVFGLNSCKKVEGEGGSSTIKGKINIQKLSSVGTLIAEYPAEEYDVYIIYGKDHTFYDDDVKTSYDGSFEFRYLQEGDYTIFTYEDCNTCASEKNVVILSTSIKGKKQEIDLGTIDVIKQ